MIKKYLSLAVLTSVVVAVIALVYLRTVGYEPKDTKPGLWLVGAQAMELNSGWSFTNQIEEIYVETRTPYFVPHSITTYCAVYNGNLYLFSAYYSGGIFPDARRWNQNVVRDPRVRLKIGDRIFNQRLSFLGNDPDKAAIHQAFVDKYPQWQSPGIENVHIFLVEST